MEKKVLLSSVLEEINKVFQEKKELAQKMAEDNKSINPNDAFFDGLENDLRVRIKARLS